MPVNLPSQMVPDTVIGVGTLVDGNLEFSGLLRVDGCLKGRVRGGANTDSTLVLSEHGRIEGEVEAQCIVINGMVTGNLRGVGRVELRAQAKVLGDVYFGILEMQLGAIVNGKIVNAMECDPKTVALAPPRVDEYFLEPETPEQASQKS